jgi:hypothetical protein
MTIPIYKYETEDGIAELVSSNASIAYTSSVHNVHINTNQLLQLKELLGSSTAQANPNQFDLYYLESILASLGWNANDDVFDKSEMWNARNTPVDKPFNFMHNEKDIIGHLTSSKVVDFNKNVISNNALAEQLPDQFDVVVGAVLYRTWSDKELQTRMNSIIEEIPTGKWCVSMECLFRNFDYAITDDSGTNKVLARNDQTSFLTKHLRMYGGTGEYGGYRIGRLLRNFTFSGKGLVDKPANPRSHITNFNESGETSSFVAAMATMEELNISNKEKVMSEVVYTKEQYEALKAELDQFKTASQQAAQKEVDTLKAQIAALTESSQALSSELEASKEVSSAKETKVVALETELAETKTKLAEAEKSIKDAEVAAITIARKALLLGRVDEEKAENLVQKFANASQEMFDALVDSLPVKAAETEAKCGDKKKDEAAKMDDEEEDKKDCKAEEIVTDLDDAKAEDKAEMASGGTQEEETLRSKASAWFSSNVLRSTHKKQE